VKKEFGRVYRSTDAAETDVWLDGLQAREATEPELAGLAAELRAWTLDQRAVKAATTATTATPPRLLTRSRSVPMPVFADGVLTISYSAFAPPRPAPEVGHS
jgi:hypothetical protein